MPLLWFSVIQNVYREELLLRASGLTLMATHPAPEHENLDVTASVAPQSRASQVIDCCATLAMTGVFTLI